MKKLSAFVIGLAVLTTAASSALAAVPQGHAPGSPIKQGRYCWTYTSTRGDGYWLRCDGHQPTIAVTRPVPKKVYVDQTYPQQIEVDIDTRFAGGGGEGGGSDGGGGGGGGGADGGK